MKKTVIVSLLFIVTLIILFVQIRRKGTDRSDYFIVGTGNPGEIIVYAAKNGKLTKTKTISTGYKFVHTVRIGDIYNNNKKYIVAGISNSFFAEPYGCKIVSYDLENYEQKVIDDVGDLRCKDLTIGDAENTGRNVIILATHGMGLVRLYKWENGRWIKEDLEENFIAQIDKEEKTNHRVPIDELTCKSCIIQTAVHIAKIADIDNSGKKAVITTHSSPLELRDKPEISFINVYRRIGSEWKRETVDRMTNREFRSITVGDIYNKGKNVLLIGIGSPRNEKGSLYAFEYTAGKWQKTVVYDDKEEKNMKGVDIADIYRDGKNRILLATGFPNANVKILTWNGKTFDSESVGRISSAFNNPDGEFNSMAANIYKTGNYPSLIIGGMETFPQKNIGWEVTDKGFLMEYTKGNAGYTGSLISSRSILAVDYAAYSD